MFDHRTALKRMFQANKWVSSQLAKTNEGIEVRKIVLNATFWKKMQYVIKSLEPIAEVLRKMDSDESQSITFIYNDMYRAKLIIKEVHEDDAQKYGPFWSVLNIH